MAADALAILVWSSLTFSAAVLAVLALRGPARRLFGARIAYGLWLIPPLAGLAWLAPARRIEMGWSPAAEGAAGTMTAALTPALTPGLLAPGPIMAVWIAGALLGLAVLAVRQWRFLRAVGPLSPARRHGAAVFASRARVGPAVVGLLKPAIVLPSDFDQRFSPRERTLVLAHERAHLAHGDPAINAAVALARCLNWFNPLAHLAADALRIDQELACDARVLDAHVEGRRCYAEAMLKSHHAAFAPPLGCAWPDRGFHPLKERIAMLKQTAPSRLRRLLGSSVVTLTAVGVCALVWGLRPAEVVAAPAPAVASLPAITPRAAPALARPAPVGVVAAATEPAPVLSAPGGAIEPRASAPVLAPGDAMPALAALPATGLWAEPEPAAEPSPAQRPAPAESTAPASRPVLASSAAVPASTAVARPVSGRHKCPAARALIPTLKGDWGVRSLGALACISQITAEAEREAARREAPAPSA